MIPIKKNLILTILVGSLFLFMLPTGGFSRIAVNGSSGGYDEGVGSSSEGLAVQSSRNSLEMYVIEGAGYYLNAYSHILVFLNRVEESDLQGMDYYEAEQILDKALAQLGSAIKTYYYLIRRAEMTPYNSTVISKLMDFDYTGFMEKWNLNSEVFSQVEEFLKKGDITGMYRYMYDQFTTIAGILYSVRAEISMGKISELSVLWRLNEYCSQTLLFGQYVSRVFYAVLGRAF